METGDGVEPVGESTEVLECEDMHLELILVDSADDVREDAFHAAVIQILNYVEDAGAPAGHMARAADNRGELLGFPN
jgi:hypothetical protein